MQAPGNQITRIMARWVPEALPTGVDPTTTTMAAGLLPLLWADGAGAEVIRRVAAPMLGGLVTSAVLTLEVLPVLYTMWRHAQLRRAQARRADLRDRRPAAAVGQPLSALVTARPSSCGASCQRLLGQDTLSQCTLVRFPDCAIARGPLPHLPSLRANIGEK